MSRILLIPGLGADHRLFRFLDFGHHEASVLRWIPPSPGELFNDYLRRSAASFELNDPVILIGVSLGALAAMELREMMPVKKTILISGIKNKFEMPPYFRWFRKTNIHHKIPPHYFKDAALLLKPLVSDGQNKEGRNLFNEMVRDADERFIIWGIDAALHWNRSSYDRNMLVHIHGSGDFVFPSRYLSHCDYLIEGGTHDLVMSRYAEINRILENEL